ncbi:MAG: hypothetical protein ACRDPY_49525 [Streptosporangiaceae bacterium]
MPTKRAALTPQLRAVLARRSFSYLLVVAKNHPVTTGIGARSAIELARRPPAWA